MTDALKKMCIRDRLHPELKKWELSSEPVLSLPDLEIDPSQRLVRCNQKEVGLTAKEYSLLCLLTVNNGRVSVSYTHLSFKIRGFDGSFYACNNL